MRKLFHYLEFSGLLTSDLTSNSRKQTDPIQGLTKQVRNIYGNYYIEEENQTTFTVNFVHVVEKNQKIDTKMTRTWLDFNPQLCTYPDNRWSQTRTRILARYQACHVTCQLEISSKNLTNYKAGFRIWSSDLSTSIKFTREILSWLISWYCSVLFKDSF